MIFAKSIICARATQPTKVQAKRELITEKQTKPTKG